MYGRSGYFILISILLLLAVNTALLDIVIFTQSVKNDSSAVNIQSTTIQNDLCPSACQTLIRLQSNQVATASSPVPARIQANPPASVGIAKEYYIPLGIGTTKSMQYDDLLTTDTTIDTSNYPPIKQVTFEVTLRNPTGNGQTLAKLFNVSDKHDVWFSEVSFEGGGSAQRSATVNLDPGNKIYRVQLKSTLGYDVYVDNSRIHITTY